MYDQRKVRQSSRSPGRDAARATLLAGMLVWGACGGSDAVAPGADPAPDPPFGGTIFIAPDLITTQDPTALASHAYLGRGSRSMFDRRVGDRVVVDAYLFEASFSDREPVEVRVNPEFGSVEAAEAEAAFYAAALGRLPRALRLRVDTVTIQAGVRPFGGGGNGVLVHTGQGARYVADGILEETLVHEASHSSLDPLHVRALEWRAAQAADPTFISDYARDFPDREDVAETVLTWMIVRYRPDRTPADLRRMIEQAVPNRLRYLDRLASDMHPFE